VSLRRETRRSGKRWRPAWLGQCFALRLGLTRRVGSIDGRQQLPKRLSHYVRASSVACNRELQRYARRKLSRAEQRAEVVQAEEQVEATRRQGMLDAGYDLYDYRVVAIRQRMIGDKIDVGEVQKTLSDWAAQGWHVKSVIETSVAGRLGPGGVSGPMIIFERRIVQPPWAKNRSRISCNHEAGHGLRSSEGDYHPELTEECGDGRQPRACRACTHPLSPARR
jgi:hypothetical protein